MNTRIPARRHALFAALLAALLASSPSCDDARRHRASEEVKSAEVAAPLPDDATPAEVATELLRTFRSLQHVRRSGLGTADGKAAYDRSMATIASLMDRDTVFKQMRTKPSAMLPKDISSARAVQIVAESWTSMLAHYVDGLLIEETLVAKQMQDAQQAVVTLEAENPEERRKLEHLLASGKVEGVPSSYGKPLEPRRPEQDALVRSAAVANGFNFPIRVKIVMRMTKIENAWRLSDLAIKMPSMVSRVGLPLSPKVPPLPQLRSTPFVSTRPA
jgi:hypothetical protein